MKNSAITMALLIALAPLHGMADGQLTGEQIRSAFSGKTFNWENLIKGVTGRSFYAADGAAKGNANGKQREGTWRIEDNTICVSWGDCLAVESDGSGGYYKLKDGTKRVVHVTDLQDGNHL